MAFSRIFLRFVQFESFETRFQIHRVWKVAKLLHRDILEDVPLDITSDHVNEGKMEFSASKCDQSK